MYTHLGAIQFFSTVYNGEIVSCICFRVDINAYVFPNRWLCVCVCRCFVQFFFAILTRVASRVFKMLIHFWCACLPDSLSVFSFDAICLFASFQPLNFIPRSSVSHAVTLVHQKLSCSHSTNNTRSCLPACVALYFQSFFRCFCCCCYFFYRFSFPSHKPHNVLILKNRILNFIKFSSITNHFIVEFKFSRRQRFDSHYIELRISKHETVSFTSSFFSAKYCSTKCVLKLGQSSATSSSFLSMKIESKRSMKRVE